MLKTLAEHNSKYYAAISNVEVRPWGRMYYNTQAPDHIDSNHAEGLSPAARNLDKILEGIEAFYAGHGLAPRLRYNQLGFSTELEAKLLERGYNIRPASYKMMLWNNIPQDGGISPGITVEKVGCHNQVEALRIILGERSWGLPETLAAIFAQEMSHPHIQYFLVRKDQMPAATGFLFSQGGLSRIDNVRTLPNYRKQGCASALVKHIQSVYTGSGGRGLYLLAGDFISGLYAKLGFTDLGRIDEFNAWRPKL
ncbi:MAG TPA: hypothetical protein DG577_10025 [Firmicutes bacterium]|nr:hypothetical protein [Bacillota bacterium]HBS92860.1 hypothetical protein [Bacillota bacterium]HCX79736.1 hypothetical protein [Bacillota bacterium]